VTPTVNAADDDAESSASVLWNVFRLRTRRWRAFGACVTLTGRTSGRLPRSARRAGPRVFC